MVHSSHTPLDTLPSLFQAGTQLVAVQSPLTERRSLLEQFLSWGDTPLYFWSAGFRLLQSIERHENKMVLTPCGSDRTDDILPFVVSHYSTGWFLLEGLLEVDDTGELSAARVTALTDTFYALQQQPNLKIVLVDESGRLPIELMALIPVLEQPFPDGEAVDRLVAAFCTQHPDITGDQPLLVRACLGLPYGELRLVLSRLSASCSSTVELAQSVLAYKVSKLKGRGLEFIAKPDVSAGGLDLLEAILERDCSLLSPQAARYGLSLPKGILLWGPPGTGKSLSAKHAALKMGVPLIAANWGSLRSPKPGQSEKNLNFLLQQCGINAPVVLFFDDFDKGFAGWNADMDGGVESRLANKLLTWMQERVEPVYVVATCNRLEKLPPELIRRFDTIVFVDLPQAGARKEIFDLHLAKYFSAFCGATPSPFGDREWRRLLKATHLCTPAEIGQIVRKAAKEAFYLGRPGHCTLDDLLSTLPLAQRSCSLIVPAIIREEEAILAIRNRASFARPAASPDTSQWAMPEQRLFQFDSDVCCLVNRLPTQGKTPMNDTNPNGYGTDDAYGSSGYNSPGYQSSGYEAPGYKSPGDGDGTGYGATEVIGHQQTGYAPPDTWNSGYQENVYDRANLLDTPYLNKVANPSCKVAFDSESASYNSIGRLPDVITRGIIIAY